MSQISSILSFFSNFNRETKSMASSSSFATDSLYSPRWKYDVFLSFRGEDTRKKFTGHMYKELKNRGIQTFKDDKMLKEGDFIPKELLNAIEESQVALVIFSKNYAASSWCLNELVKIMECKEKNGQIVIPVFFDVDPSEVRKQTKSFAEAFAEHESKYQNDVEGMQKVQGWRTALTTVANLKGYDVCDDEIEAEKITQIVDHISSEYCKSARYLSYLHDVVGIYAHLEELKSRLQIEINDVRVLGIWGIGGVGKTTIAKALFDTLSDQFKSACFLADVKENAKKNELHSLQNTLLSELLRRKDVYVNNKHDGKSMIPRRLCSMKVLIVLDDIDHGDHLEYLAGDISWFGNGSRVIVTTKNRQLIEKDDAIYEVRTLPDHEAMQLFNQHAFKKKAPDELFKELSLEVVNHAKGLPLALKVWGSSLHKKDLIQWRSTINQIKKIPNSEIVEKLKISYDGLELEQQKIFLDIACFFLQYNRKKVMQILENCSFEAECGLGVLIDKSLVFISEYDTIEMHDLIEEMGKYIVKMQKDSGKLSRIWNVEDFEDVMMGNTGTIAVEAIWIPSYRKLRFSKEAIKNMQKLRILCIILEENDGPIEYLSNNLRWFVCYKYPWKLLPQNFNPTSLVHLELQRSSLHHLWNENKRLPSLRVLDLRYSTSLKSTPDFSGMPNLEYLYLEGCKSLEEVHHSLRCSRKLTELNLNECESLERFPYVNVESLKSLYLMWNKFPEFIGRMKPGLKIMMTFTGIREIPSSICKLKCLVKLNVSKCSKLENLPEEIGDLENLEKLNASYTLISRPPSSIIRLNKLKSLTFAKEDGSVCFVFPQVNEGLRSLEDLDLSYCNLIDGGLPEDIGSLFSLKTLYLRGNNFEHLPRSIAQLGALQSLDISHCNKQKKLPCFTGMSNLHTLNLRYCNLIDGALPEDIGCLHSLKELDLSGNNFENLPRSIAQLGALQSLHLSYCKELKELPCFTGMPNLDTLKLSYCNLIDGALPEDIGSLSSLKELNLSGNNFEHLPRSIAQLGALQSLDLSYSKSLKSAPDFMWMPNLEYLDLSSCKRLEEVHHSLRCCTKLIELNLSYCKSLERFPYVNVESLESLDLVLCSSLEEFPEFIGRMKPELVIMMPFCGIRELPSSIIHLLVANLTKLDLSSMKNLVSLPSSICKLKGLVTLYVSCCSKLESLPEEIGDLENLEELHASCTLISHPPSSIVQLNKLKLLTFKKYGSEDKLVHFVFPQVNEGLLSLEELDLSYCNLTDGGLPEDIGSLSSLEELNLSGNNFEHLPQSIAQLGALRSLDLSYCKNLKELSCFTGMTYCNLIDGALPEGIGSLSSLKELNLRGNNFEHLPRTIAQLGALRSLHLSDCKRLTQLPEFPQKLDRINADWSNGWICNSLFQNISSLQHDISFSIRVFTSWSNDIPSWFHHQGMDTSVSVNLRENWYASDNFLGFAVCYSGKIIDITAHLIPLRDDVGRRR